MIRFRRASVADEPVIHTLTPELARFELPAWRTAEQVSRADDAILADALRSGREDALVLLAEADDVVLGVVFVSTRTDYFTGLEHGHIEVLAIRPEAQGQGLGRALVAEAERWSRARGHGAMTLNVFDANHRARGLYERLGYAPETVHYWKRL